ncbi:unnamed protein product, partial [Ixodes pacificus]
MALETIKRALGDPKMSDHRFNTLLFSLPLFRYCPNRASKGDINEMEVLPCSMCSGGGDARGDVPRAQWPAVAVPDISGPIPAAVVATLVRDGAHHGVPPRRPPERCAAPHAAHPST